MSRARFPLLLAVAFAPAALGAQATNDEARLVVGVMGGYIGGGNLWTTTQPVFANGNRTDQFRLVRDLRGNITMAGQLTYFPTPGFGWTGEITYIGLGSIDGCSLSVDNGDVFNRVACAAIDRRKRAASGVAALAGVVVRSASRGDLQPYLRGNVGLALVPRSTTAMVAFFGEDDENALVIYQEDDAKAAKPMAALSIGVATAPRAGYQFRIEARANAVQLPVVTGPTARGNIEPPVGTKWTILPSITIGLDVVLEKRRGRRY